MLVLVVGPSGAGKDSLLNGARVAFRDDPRISFARRAITRPPDPDGEAHESLTPEEFDARAFALSWPAHGLRYGISGQALSATPVVVANVSRGVIADAAARFPVHVIEVTAPPSVLAARLIARGRETAADIARRLDRTVIIPDGVTAETVMNDGTLAEGIARFSAALRRAIDRTRDQSIDRTRDQSIDKTRDQSIDQTRDQSIDGGASPVRGIRSAIAKDAPG